MPSVDRSRGRNAFIYDGKARDVLLGGFVLNNGVSKANLYSMVEIFLLFQTHFSVTDEDDVVLERNEEPLSPGSYYVLGRP